MGQRAVVPLLIERQFIPDAARVHHELIVEGVKIEAQFVGMAVRAVRPVFQKQADGARRRRGPQDAVADAEEVHALPFHGRLLLVRVAVVEHRDGELLEMGVEVASRSG